MFSITPIGSCRITTPLKRGQAQHGFALNMDRCYGYCHSPAEAVQMALFMQGKVEIAPEIWPLVSRSHGHRQIAHDRHVASDLYVVELCSAKEVTIDGVSIQLNYLKTTFADFFAENGRAVAFWALVDDKDPDALMTFLQTEWSATEAQREQSETLGRLRREFVTRHSLRENIDRLIDLLPRVLFITHVDAAKPDGRTIKSRSEFIKLVEEEVAAAGGQVFNPTDLMHDMGQPHAIEDESAGLAHFTDSFADRMMAAWMRTAVKPATDSLVRADLDYVRTALRPQITASQRQGAFHDAATRLEAFEATPDIDRLLDETRSAAQSALEAFHRDQEAADPTTAARQFDRACGLGLFTTAIEIQSEYPDATGGQTGGDLLRHAEQAAASGNQKAASELGMLAWRKGCANAASQLAVWATQSKTDLLKDFGRADRSSLLDSVAPSLRIELLHLNGAEFTEAVDADTSPEEMAELATTLWQEHGIGHAAEVLAYWRDLIGANRIANPDLVALLDEWVSNSLATENELERIHLMNAVLYASPRHGPARNAMRDMRKALALRIREAGAAGDIDTLDALTAEVAALTNGLPELDLWRARLRFKAREFDRAIELGQSAAEGLPEKLDVWVLLMRSAVKLGQSTQAHEFAKKVYELSTEATPKFTAEAVAVLKTELIEA